MLVPIVALETALTTAALARTAANVWRVSFSKAMPEVALAAVLACSPTKGVRTAAAGGTMAPAARDFAWMRLRTPAAAFLSFCLVSAMGGGLLEAGLPPLDARSSPLRGARLCFLTKAPNAAFQARCLAEAMRTSRLRRLLRRGQLAPAVPMAPCRC